MSRLVVPLLVVVATLALGGCGEGVVTLVSDPGALDAGGDAGPGAPDAGVGDAGARDAGHLDPADAGAGDAGAATVPDAGGVDAGRPGPPDAGAGDAGVPGPTDAGAADAGSPASVVLFSNFGPADSVCTTCNFWNTGVHPTEQPYRRAMSFLVPAGPGYRLDAVEVSAFQVVAGTTVAATYLVAVASDAAGLPDAELERFTFTGLPSGLESAAVLRGTSTARLQLTGGRRYWLTTDVTTPTAMYAGWPQNDQGSTGLVAWRAGTAPWSNPWGTPQPLGAFRVRATPLP